MKPRTVVSILILVLAVLIITGGCSIFNSAGRGDYASVKRLIDSGTDINGRYLHEEKTALIKYYPGADSDILNYYIKKGYRGIVIEMVGLGQLATQESEKNWIPAIKKAIDKGIIICAVPQTLYGRLNPYVYSTGRTIKKAGVLYLEDMLPETAYIKLGWVLGHTKDKEKIKKLMLRNIAGELNERISEETFLY